MKIRGFAMGAAVAALVAAGCSGGSELSLREYFTKLHEVSALHEKEFKDLAAEFQSSLQGASSDSQALPLLKRYLGDSVTVFDDLVTDLDAIDPPAEVQSQHAELIAASEGIRDGFEGVIDRFDEFGSVDEVSKFFTTDLADVNKRGDDACIALQTVADANDINVDLDCGGAPAQQ